MAFRIDSRWPAWARWRPVTARPHDERHPFDPVTRVLTFPTRMEAADAARAMESANGGEYVAREVSPLPTPNAGGAKS